jgi:hypothetical protein
VDAGTQNLPDVGSSDLEWALRTAATARHSDSRKPLRNWVAQQSLLISIRDDYRERRRAPSLSTQIESHGGERLACQRKIECPAPAPAANPARNSTTLTTDLRIAWPETVIGTRSRTSISRPVQALALTRRTVDGRVRRRFVGRGGGGDLMGLGLRDIAQSI